MFSGRIRSQAVAAMLAAVTLATPAVAGAELPRPAGPVLLQVTGAITITNDGAAASFDRALLEALPQHRLETYTDWTEGPQVFEGPLAGGPAGAPRSQRHHPARNRDGLVLIVEDDGPGIAAEDLERVKEPFYQSQGNRRRHDGCGLGLSIVKAFAELHGGRLDLASQVGLGTRVTVRFPSQRLRLRQSEVA